jgi:protein-L-isoaspartate O-methyltransferase
MYRDFTICTSGHLMRSPWGDGHQGWPQAAPYDGILVTCAPEAVPPTLVAQLKPGPLGLSITKARGVVSAGD